LSGTNIAVFSCPPGEAGTIMRTLVWGALSRVRVNNFQTGVQFCYAGAISAAKAKATSFIKEGFMAKTDKETKGKDANRDPISGEPGSHPIGTAIGAATLGAAMGAGAGSIIGPVGTALGAAGGAVLGGLTGNAIAERLDPTAEEAFWREKYATEPYYQNGLSYDEYAPAYRTGYQGRARYDVDVEFAQVERDLEADYNSSKGKSKLTWERAKPATRAAWDRLARSANKS
jgi:hypothetical protein